MPWAFFLRPCESKGAGHDVVCVCNLLSGSYVLEVMARFEAMADEWRHRIYTFAYYSLGSREEAEDVTQDVLVRLWQHWPRLEPGHVIPWIIRVTRNACCDIHRQRQTRHALLANPVNDPPQPSPMGPDPVAELEASDFRQQVERVLREVDEPYRTIVILREIEGLAYAQIATALALPLGTVKVYLHRGRRRLRERMREDVAYDVG